MSGPAAMWTPPWDWEEVSIRALMRVRGDSAHALATAVYVCHRAAQGWLYDGAKPGPDSAKQPYRLWSALEPWQREVFDRLRAAPPSGEDEPVSDSARADDKEDGTDRRHVLTAAGKAGLAVALAPLDALERVAADITRPGRVDHSLIASHESIADTFAVRHV